MTRDNLLFAIIGLLLGFILGFMFYSTLAQRSTPAAATTSGSQNLPADHPPVGADAGGNPRQVFAQVQEALKRAKDEPANFEAQAVAAQLEYEIRNYDKAIDYLVKANQLRPDHYGTIASLGMVNMDAGHLEVAEKWYRKALAKKADDVTVLDGLCNVLLSAGKAKPAEEAVNQLAKLDPSNEDLPQFRERLNSLKNSSK
jgi:tetratricopeptide (TPR) repeat protein